MRNNKILKEILKDEKLKEKYWKNVNIDNENINTASMHNNKNIKMLATLLSDNSKPMKIRIIKTTYNL